MNSPAAAFALIVSAALSCAATNDQGDDRANEARSEKRVDVFIVEVGRDEAELEGEIIGRGGGEEEEDGGGNPSLELGLRMGLVD